MFYYQYLRINVFKTKLLSLFYSSELVDELRYYTQLPCFSVLNCTIKIRCLPCKTYPGESELRHCARQTNSHIGSIKTGPRSSSSNNHGLIIFFFFFKNRLIAKAVCISAALIISKIDLLRIITVRIDFGTTCVYFI